MSQQYSLRWNNHQPNFISMFGNLLATKDLVDVTLAAEGQHLVAHKVVLSACSTYFHSLFVDNPTHHPIVILKDVTFNDLRTMVDFMYYGEVNVTEMQLAQVLETAKILKIKGLTEMPDSTSLTRSQGIPTEFPTTETSNDTQRPSVSPSSPIRRKRQRKSSSGSLANPDELMQSVDMMREAVTLSSLNIHKKRELDDRIETAQQTEDASSMNIDQLALDTNAVGMSQGAQWNMMEHQYPRYSNAGIGGGGLQPEQAMYMNNVIHPHGDEMSHYAHALGAVGPVPGPSSLPMINEQVGQIHSAGLPPAKRRRTTNPQGSLGSPSGGRLRRSKYFKRQSRVPDEREVRKQVSEPTPSSAGPVLQKHESYPQYSAPKINRRPRNEHSVGSLSIRALAMVDRQSSTSASGSTSVEAAGASQTQRASHTPAVRSGPPLSCNFCWNTVDECGRILRRKTQYHCPECRTNLCIVPCFHEYHDGNDADVTASAR